MKENKQNNNTINEAELVNTTFADFKNALLVVSVFVNLFIFTMWLTLQMTDRYNTALIRVFLG